MRTLHPNSTPQTLEAVPYSLSRDLWPNRLRTFPHFSLERLKSTIVSWSVKWAGEVVERTVQGPSSSHCTNLSGCNLEFCNKALITLKGRLWGRGSVPEAVSSSPVAPRPLEDCGLSAWHLPSATRLIGWEQIFLF